MRGEGERHLQYASSSKVPHDNWAELFSDCVLVGGGCRGQSAIRVLCGDHLEEVLKETSAWISLAVSHSCNG